MRCGRLDRMMKRREAHLKPCLLPMKFSAVSTGLTFIWPMGKRLSNEGHGFSRAVNGLRA